MLRSDRPYGERILRGRRRRSGRAGSGLRSRLLRIAKGIVIYEYPTPRATPYVQVVIIVEGGGVRHRTKVIHVACWVHIRPEWVVVHSNESRAAVGVVPHNHPIRAIERRFPNSCYDATPVRGIGYPNYHMMLQSTRPQIVLIPHRADEYLRCMWSKDGLRVGQRYQFSGKDKQAMVARHFQ